MKICSRCGAENLPEANFCRNCGFAFSQENPESASAPEASAALAEAPFAAPAAPVVSAAAPILPMVPNQPSAPPVFVENRTPFTKKTFLELYKGVKKAGIVILICGVILFALSEAILIGDWEKRDLYGSISVFGILFIGIGILYLFLPKIASKNQKLITDQTYRIFRFDEIFIHAALFDGEAKIEELNIPYTAVTKVCRKGNFLWVWSGNAALPINVFTFTTGTKEELQNLLLAKCGPRIVKIKK